MGDIYVRRCFQSEDATFGTMHFDEFSCFTLEPRKAGGVNSFVPLGRYPVISSRTWIPVMFQNNFPMIPLVQCGIGEIRIHIGNYAVNTHGCLLVGRAWNQKQDMIENSTAAYRDFDKIFQRNIATTGATGKKLYIQYSPLFGAD